MPAKYTKWMNIWKNLTLLDSSQLEVFFGNFSFFGIQIWILNLGRFETGRNPVKPDRFRSVVLTLIMACRHIDIQLTGNVIANVQIYLELLMPCLLQQYNMIVSYWSLLSLSSSFKYKIIDIGCDEFPYSFTFSVCCRTILAGVLTRNANSWTSSLAWFQSNTSRKVSYTLLY